MASWDRQPKEPPKAWQQFTQFRDLGPDRTYAKTAQILGIGESYLRTLGAQWSWTERGDQWDAYVKGIQDRAFLTEAAKAGKLRAQAFRALLSKALEALKHVDLEKVPLQQVAAAMKIATEGLRLEEGLETARVSMEVNDARVLLSRLPAEVRSGLVRLFEADTPTGGDAFDLRALPATTGRDEREG